MSWKHNPRLSAGIVTDETGQNTIATVNHWHPDHKCNLAIIVAAPDMLAALQKIVALHPADSILTEIKAARAAIEKATL
jgi:hypothetical protein